MVGGGGIQAATSPWRLLWSPWWKRHITTVPTYPHCHCSVSRSQTSAWSFSLTSYPQHRSNCWSHLPFHDYQHPSGTELFLFNCPVIRDLEWAMESVFRLRCCESQFGVPTTAQFLLENWGGQWGKLQAHFQTSLGLVWTEVGQLTPQQSTQIIKWNNARHRKTSTPRSHPWRIPKVDLIEIGSHQRLVRRE